MSRPAGPPRNPTTFDVLGNPELDPVRDWRELISRVADHCIARTYADHGPDRERRWQGHYTRRVLEEVLDTKELPIAWADVQTLAQAALIETMEQAAILGAALVMSWPASPAGFASWPDQAIALAGLRTDDGGIAIAEIAGEVDRRLDRRRGGSAN